MGSKRLGVPLDTYRFFHKEVKGMGNAIRVAITYGVKGTRVPRDATILAF